MNNNQIELNLNIDSEKNQDEKNSVLNYNFSHENFSTDIERRKLEEKYTDKLCVTESFNRQLVSYQGNKTKSIHNWFKYREGFSSQLVENLIKEFNITEGNTILDPFSGSSTTSLTAQKLGINSIAIDILPIAKETFEVKNNIYDYDLFELNKLFAEISTLIPQKAKKQYKHIRITQHAFSEQTENDLLFFKEWIEQSHYSKIAKELINFILFSILEEVSYTRKDGQYLRWDYRSEKVQKSNRRRKELGKPPIKTVLNKGILPDVKEALLKALMPIIEDIEEVQKVFLPKSEHTFINKSGLYALAKLDDNSIDSVITSPPYCNRYDYTRTYALELNYLGIDEEKIRELRQMQMSCTVENKSKLEELEEYYNSLGLQDGYKKIYSLIKENSVLSEINEALIKRWNNGDVNNKGITTMVDGYFSELTFIFYEIFRVCKPGSKVAFVNDNVRYAGEIIPVDFLSSKIAEDIGFKVEKIYTLKQKKGNSSQQMKKFGRAALRKSITIWEKPLN